MKFSCERDVLVDALGTASRATASRGGALPVLAGIRAQLSGDILTLTGHDLELTISVEMSDGVRGGGDGVGVLPARLVSDVVKSLPAGAVEVEVEGEQASITAGRSEFTLRVFPVEEYPRLPEPSGDAVTIDAAELARRSSRSSPRRRATTPGPSSPACW